MKEAIKLVKKWWYNRQLDSALEEVAYWEGRAKWINAFFMGETKAKIEEEKRQVKLKEAREKYEAIKQKSFGNH